jgi:alginate O-acetyltransferase complex protein AlgI
MALCGVCVFQPIQAHDMANNLNPKKLAFCAAMLLLAIMTMFTQTYNPFLYFQF